jgi:hypothetical protein
LDRTGSIRVLPINVKLTLNGKAPKKYYESDKMMGVRDNIEESLEIGSVLPFIQLIIIGPFS